MVGLLKPVERERDCCGARDDNSLLDVCTDCLVVLSTLFSSLADEELREESGWATDRQAEDRELLNKQQTAAAAAARANEAGDRSSRGGK